MEKDHRRELYSPASREAQQAPDAVGPDGVRVTVRAEPALDRYLRWRFRLSTPAVLTDPVGTYLDYRALPRLVQRYVLRGRWVVEVEADSGERCRVKAENRDDALAFARRIHDGVQARGVAFLSTFAR
jgi:hypothetical protein